MACWHSPIVMDCAISSVNKFARFINEASISCFPLVSVPIQAICVPNFTLKFSKIGSKLDVIVTITSLVAPNSFNVTISKGNPISSATLRKLSSFLGERFHAITFSNFLCSTTARN